MRQFDCTKEKPGGAGLFDEYLFQSIHSSVCSHRRITRPACLTSLLADLLGELGDLVRQARYLPARIVLVNDIALRGLHQFWFRAHHRLQRRIAVAILDGFLDGTNRATHLGTARLIDDGAAGNLAGRLFGGSGIGHVLNYPSADIARVVGLSAPAV